MKRLVGLELSHQKAPLAIREKISMTNEDHSAALQALKDQVDEVFLVSTCNRLSLYALASDLQPLYNFFRELGDLDPYLSVFDHDTSAIRHLFSTASGLESQAIGEHEILGQIKKAYAQAQEMKCIGATMDELVRKAIFVGKKVRKETAIGKYPVSLASVAYDVIRDVHHHLSGLKVLVLGTGEMSSLMLKIIAKKQLQEIYVASRTFSRAQTLANMYNGTAIELSNIGSILQDVDVIIGATHATTHVLGREDFEKFSFEKPKTLVDLGLPRNFDPELKNINQVKLFDLDDLKSMTDQGLQKRQEEIPKAMDIIEEELADFIYWLNTRQISPLISSYYDKMEQIRQEELKWALPKLGNLDENQQRIIENMLSRLTRRVSGKPIEMLRQFSQEPHIEQNPIDTFKELFDL
jgi:glutamyl-tRNA reductase